MFNSQYHRETGELHTEFVKECHRNSNAIPISSIIIQDWFKPDLYALLNQTITLEQTSALSKTFKYIKKDIKEICFANNNMTDKQFADILDAIVSNEKQHNTLQKITYGTNNELGTKTLKSLENLILNKIP